MATTDRAGQRRVECEVDPAVSEAESIRVTQAETNRAVVRHQYEAINRRDLAAVTADMAPVNMDHWQRSMRGLEQLFAAFPDGRYELEDILADGDTVAARDTFRGTHTGTFMGIAPTGRAVTLGSIHFVRLSGGKVVAHWVESDLLGLLRQLGASPAPGE